jgi:hypothetical protein
MTRALKVSGVVSEGSQDDEFKDDFESKLRDNQNQDDFDSDFEDEE